MSRDLAYNTICLQPTEQIAHTEYSLNYHQGYISQLTGQTPPLDEAAMAALYDQWQIDFLWGNQDGLKGDWAKHGRATDMGHAVYAADGSDQRQPQNSPFQEPEEVWAFDPVAEYGLPDFAEQVAAYQAYVDNNRTSWPDIFIPGGYYKTMVSGAIQAFGWDMLLLAAADPHKMEQVFDRIYQWTRFHMDAWAKTDAEVIIQHDDFVWTSGPFMRPDFYRQVLIPRYAELWKPLKASGKKILFCSDGTYTMFMDDILVAGADGLIFEPCNDFAWVVERFGDRACLVGSAVDCRTMTFEPWEAVKAQIDTTLALAPQCRGLIWAVGNHLPGNIEPQMMQQYIDYLKPRL